MKRDWDIIREILQKTENLGPNTHLTLDDFDSEKACEVSYHMQLLDEAGLIDVIIDSTSEREPKSHRVFKLNWKGHELLDSIRSEAIWQKTKDFIANKEAPMNIEVVKRVASDLLKNSIGF